MMLQCADAQVHGVLGHAVDCVVDVIAGLAAAEVGWVSIRNIFVHVPCKLGHLRNNKPILEHMEVFGEQAENIDRSAEARPVIIRIWS